MARPQAQIIAKTLTFIMLAGLAFLIGRGSPTAATVGELTRSDKTIGIIILATCAVAGLMMYIKSR